MDVDTLSFSNGTVSYDIRGHTVGGQGKVPSHYLILFSLQHSSKIATAISESYKLLHLILRLPA